MEGLYLLEKLSVNTPAIHGLSRDGGVAGKLHELSSDGRKDN